MFHEQFEFTYTWLDEETGAMETVTKKVHYPEGVSLYEERGPLEVFKEFLKGAGYGEIDFNE